MAVRRRPATDAPERLTPEQRDRVRIWAASHAPTLELHLGRHWAQCRDWHLANGVLRCDWEAAFRNWLRKSLEIEAARVDPATRRGQLRLIQGG